MHPRRLIISLIALAACLTSSASGAATADTESLPADSVLRPVNSHFTLSVGRASIINTYLTPLRYHGSSGRVGYDRSQAFRHCPDRLIHTLDLGMEVGRTDNPAMTNRLWRLSGDFTAGLLYRWRLPYSVTLAAGTSSSVNLGVVYSPRNGNNPVAVEASATVNATAAAMWHGSLLGRRVTVTYRPTLPVVGVFFSPDYGELFYEISLGNHAGLAHLAWWPTYFRMTNLLTADIMLGATEVRLGFRSDILSTRVNNITTRVATAEGVVGLGGDWLSLNPRRSLSPQARIISATY